MFDLCPRCGRSPKLAESDNPDKCPHCGFESQPEKHSKVLLGFGTIAKGILVTVAILVGLGLVVIAVVFAGCVCSSGGRF